MKHVLEWVLAGSGTLLCIGSSADLFAQSVSNPHAGSLWPFPAFLIVEIAVLGLVGSIASILDAKPHLARMRSMIWMASGGLLGLALLNVFSMSVASVLATSALLFGGVAVLANLHQSRQILMGLGVLIVSAVASFALNSILIGVSII